MEDVINMKYRELACASIAFGINEYLMEDKTDVSDDEFIRWIYECEWFDILNLNREMVIDRAMELKDLGIKHVFYMQRKEQNRNGKEEKDC